MSNLIWRLTFTREFDLDRTWVSPPEARKKIRSGEFIILEAGWRYNNDTLMFVMTRREFDYVRQRLVTDPDYLQILLLKGARSIEFTKHPPERYAGFVTLVRSERAQSLAKELITDEAFAKTFMVCLAFPAKT